MTDSFRTEVKIEKSKWEINFASKMLFIGSCFSDHIGGLLSQNKFPVLQNPFGVLFNPASIAQLINRTMEKREFSTSELILHKGLYYLMDLHGDFSSPEPVNTIEMANEALDNTFHSLSDCEYLVVTFGTSWIYEFKQTGQVVSNCHKIPSCKFRRRCLSIDEIVNIWSHLLTRLQKFNPKIKIIFTTSPIRHLKDGAHENQLSKATLLVAQNEIIERNKDMGIEYFPSYEIMLDELRDYRFYADDMLHVSKVSNNYIFQKFQTKYFSSDTNEIIQQIKKILSGYNHRIMKKKSSETKHFANSMLNDIDILEKRHLNINFQTEKKHFIELLQFSE